jgi:membrane protein implicated in regulation of membrane protease activity
VNDGSTDSTAEIASAYPVRLVTTENAGLGAARNVGIRAATGEIVAFIDDDAYPDVHWLRFLAMAFQEGPYVGVGGPNIPPPGDGWTADAVANAPGGPNPVLFTDRLAEHLPGCNMAFRREALEAVGGFDPVFRAAGDDVDVCIRLRERGGSLGYAPAAFVWHDRRASIRRYWKQQAGYGKAEALLERKWPGRYNAFGQLSWGGRIYGRGLSLDLSSLGGRVYQGTWGTAPFQSLYDSGGSGWSFTLMPEWYLVIGLLAGMTALGLGWAAAYPLGAALALAAGLSGVEAWVGARRAREPAEPPKRKKRRTGLRAVVWCLYLIQPIARLRGRLGNGLTPWRRRGPRRPSRFRSLVMTYWRDKREEPEDTLRAIQRWLREEGAVVRAGSEFDAWDLEVWGGLFGSSRLVLAIEEHAPGKQLLRFRQSPRISRSAVAGSAAFAAMAIGAFVSGALVSAAASGLLAVGILGRAISDAGFAGGMLRDLLVRFGASSGPEQSRSGWLGRFRRLSLPSSGGRPGSGFVRASRARSRR